MRHFIRWVWLCGLAVTTATSTLDAQGSAEGVARRAAAGTPQPGDRIRLHFLRELELTDTVVVNAQGVAVLPKLGPTPVSGIAIGALGDTLRARYATYLREPDLEVLVMRRVVVTGEVKNPDVYFVDGVASVRDAIAMAGGVLTTGSPGKVEIIRGAQRTLVRDWERSTGPETDLMSGDMVSVGRRNWLSLNFLAAVSTAAVFAGVVFSIVR